MLTRTRTLVGAVVVIAAMVLTLVAADPASAQPNQNQRGLVNVAVGDVTVLENVGIGVAAQLAANLCGLTVGNVAALAAGVLQTQNPVTVCTIRQGDQNVPVTIGRA